MSEGLQPVTPPEFLPPRSRLSGAGRVAWAIAVWLFRSIWPSATHNSPGEILAHNLLALAVLGFGAGFVLIPMLWAGGFTIVVMFMTVRAFKLGKNAAEQTRAAEERAVGAPMLHRTGS